MNRMIEGQTVFVRGGVPVRVVIAPDPVAGIKALVEFADRSREWFPTPDVFETEDKSVRHEATEKCRALHIQIRDLEFELEEVRDEYERAKAIRDAKEKPDADQT